MTEENFKKLYDMLSANVNNTNLVGTNLKLQYDKTVNIERNLALAMQNQVYIMQELEKIKTLVTSDKNLS